MPTVSFNETGLSAGTSSFSATIRHHFFWSNPSQSWWNAGWRYLTFKIMQGIEPSNFSGFTSVTSYDGDLLFKVTPGLQGAITTTQVTAGELWRINYIQNNPATATASGTATWFWAYSDGTSNGTGTTPRIIIRGTVGTEGSGADMILTSTSIVSGADYLLTNLFQLELPLIYSW